VAGIPCCIEKIIFVAGEGTARTDLPFGFAQGGEDDRAAMKLLRPGCGVSKTTAKTVH